jgi:hypothetical protein
MSMAFITPQSVDDLPNHKLCASVIGKIHIEFINVDRGQNRRRQQSWGNSSLVFIAFNVLMLLWLISA